MRSLSRVSICTAFAVASASLVLAQEVANWTAPPYWSATVAVRGSEEGSRGLRPEVLEALPTAPVPFVGIAPCRIVDTRGNGFTGAYGPPALSGGATARAFNVPAGPCPGIPAGAAAFSINIAAILPGADGFLTAFPTGSAQPNASTLNFLGGEVVANSAVIAAGTSGSISMFVNVTTHVIIDINGYYAGSVVTRLNSLSGDVTLAAGSNVTITPSGQTLTIASTGGGLPSGAANQTLRHNGTSWAASGALTNNGTDVGLTGTLALPSPVQVTAGGFRFLHNGGAIANTFLGLSAGNFGLTGFDNVGVGLSALSNITTGSYNTAIGTRAMENATTAGTVNTAVGSDALRNSSGSANTAIGGVALALNGAGGNNTAVGYAALGGSTGGSNNIAIGFGAGNLLSTGSNNIYIGNPGTNESGQIRIGTVANITQGTVIVGIYGFGTTGGIPVYVNSGGRLGTSTSSRRYKEDIRDVGESSAGLMDLRPVAFKYKREHDDSGLTQYGLIAEEVAEIYPEMVAYDDEGRPQAIRSQLLDPLLLNEVQKQHRALEGSRAEIEGLKRRLAELEARLSAGGEERKRASGSVSD